MIICPHWILQIPETVDRQGKESLQLCHAYEGILNHEHDFQSCQLVGWKYSCYADEERQCQQNETKVVDESTVYVFIVGVVDGWQERRTWCESVTPWLIRSSIEARIWTLGGPQIEHEVPALYVFRVGKLNGDETWVGIKVHDWVLKVTIVKGEKDSCIYGFENIEDRR